MRVKEILTCRTNDMNCLLILRANPAPIVITKIKRRERRHLFSDMSIFS